ncbi:Uncharacterised protein [Achromobacter spanius]|uniref:hypothetical protein n=1 Tax=Achromobacter spanius TaxID=217203 RepID=UPI000C2C5EC7|nr:hypothetical protein [Achromobacter spanius]AUA57832.1 hypothetical protein CVS48_18525 [Achromobacter spanius]CAB3626588.1 hypothetical protein LMG5911_00392 [Achromobacter spanius]SPT37210.1 Uncharacterised protein [Achromobacter denitrificans]VEE60127.1 Uncharacterised protein [Achromobacter spanius]
MDISWTALLLPPIVVALLTSTTAWAWRGKSKTVLLDPDKAALPFVTAISVLAIGIPLDAAFMQEVLKSEVSPWVADLLLSAMMLAVLSLFVGAYVVYTLLLDAPKDPATGKVILGGGRIGLPAAMGCQYSSLIAFLACTVVALAAYSIQARSPAPQLAHGIGTVSIERPIPELGTSREVIFKVWGEPDTATAQRLEYSGKTSQIVFCLDKNKLRAVVYTDRDKDHAQRTTCGVDP